jgi:hypothetical protein
MNSIFLTLFPSVLPVRRPLQGVLQQDCVLKKMLPAFASSSIRRVEPSRSSSGVELQLETGHQHGDGNHELKFTMVCNLWQVKIDRY